MSLVRREHSYVFVLNNTVKGGNRINFNHFWELLAVHRLYPIGHSEKISAKWFMGTFWIPKKKNRSTHIALEKIYTGSHISGSARVYIYIYIYIYICVCVCVVSGTSYLSVYIYIYIFLYVYINMCVCR